MSPRKCRKGRKGNRSGGRTGNNRLDNDGIAKDCSKEETLTPVDEQQESTQLLEPEYLTCASQAIYNTVLQYKKQNGAEADPIEAYLSVKPAAPVVISGNGRRSIPQKAVTHKEKSSLTQATEATSPSFVSDIPSDTLKQCGVAGTQNHSIGQPKRPSRRVRATVAESGEDNEGQNVPASEVEHTCENTDPERDVEDAPEHTKQERAIKDHITSIHQAVISDLKGSKTISTMPVASEDSMENICSTAILAEQEQLPNRFSGPSLSEVEKSRSSPEKSRSSLEHSEEDIYRGEEEIVREFGEPASQELTKLGLAPEMDIMQYCHKEWRGKTVVAELMKKGYEAVSHDFTSIRRVRGDNYCALRALLYQAMSQTAELPAWLMNPDFIELPAKLISTYDWIKHWKLRYSFGEEQTSAQLDTIKKHLELLKKRWEKLSEVKIPEVKQMTCDEIFQNDDEAYNLYEAVKFLMLSKAIDLYVDYTDGKEVPIFSWLLFARNTSSNPEEFMKNHLNQVGYTGGLEQGLHTRHSPEEGSKALDLPTSQRSEKNDCVERSSTLDVDLVIIELCFALISGSPFTAQGDLEKVRRYVHSVMYVQFCWCESNDTPVICYKRIKRKKQETNNTLL
ncbi:uncharacterized protein [Ambystoma mexicanum]|uniref:uncharacterized protein isoform X2 n=1 Tax=Ambystoma mexicanum TaxID=8296 RepID=UPI0037E7E715